MKRILAAGAAILVAGCAQRPIPATSASASRQQANIQALCPARGTEMRTSAGRLVHYHGPKPGDPESCGIDNGFLLYGLVQDNEQNRRNALPALRGLFPMRVGNTASIITMTQTTWDTSYTTFQVLREERIRVPAGTFNTWVIRRRHQESTQDQRSNEILLWFDKVTGVRVRTEVSVAPTETASAIPSWRAVQLTVAQHPPQPRR